MRLISTAVLTALLATPASAADAPKPMMLPDWVSVPAGEASGYPETARGQNPPASGQAVVRCRWHQDKTLDHCSVVSETPDGLGFGDAAVLAASLSDAAAPPPNAVMANGDIIIPVSFNGAAAAGDEASTGTGHIITNPDWLRKPSGSDLARFFPDAASRANMGGRVRMVCFVSMTGSLEGCRVVSETPEGFGFGAAALAMSKIFSMRPRMVDGESIKGGVIVLPIDFGGPDARTFATPVWAQNPTPAQIAAAFPKEAIGVESGRVVLSCGVGPFGRLWPCQVATEAPQGRGFGAAAKQLASDFQIAASAYDNVGGIKQVTLPITFYAPDADRIDPITKPVWTRMIDPGKAQSLFPTKAAAAGLRAGKGVVV